MDADRRLAATRLSVLAVGKTVEATVHMPRADRDGLLRELRDMLVRYFEPLDREFAAGAAHAASGARAPRRRAAGVSVRGAAS
jgi:hypothetical protein